MTNWKQYQIGRVNWKHCALREPIVPHARRSDQVCVVSERGEGQLRLLGRDETATLADDLANAFEEKIGAFHYAAAQDNRIGSEEINQIGQAQAEVVGFVLDGLLRNLVTFPSQFANALRSNAGPVQITGRRMSVNPSDHRWTRCQGLPTSAKAARALRTGRIDDLMSNLRVCSVDSAVKLAVKNNSPTDAGADCDVDQ